MDNWTDAIPDHHMPDFQAVRAVWQEMRPGDGIPARADLNPMDLGCALPICFLTERMAGHGGRFRLVGRALNNAYDMDLRSIPLPALVAAPLQKNLAANIDSVFEQGKLLFAKYGTKDSAPDRSLLLQPLQDGQGRTTLALGIAAGFSHGASLGELTVQHQCGLLPLSHQMALPQKTAPSNVVPFSGDRSQWAAAQNEKGAHQSARPKLHVVP